MFMALRLLAVTTTVLSTMGVLDQPSAALSSLSARPVDRIQSVESAANAGAAALARPHLLNDEFADVIVRIGGGTVCSGTPITGTRFVVTAAHCVLDANGAVAGGRTVERDGAKYTPVSVLVDPAYHDSPRALLDAAVLVMAESIPGPSANLGDFPTSGLVTIAGYQSLDSDGSLLRGTTYDERPLPQGTHGGLVVIERAAAGCVVAASKARVYDSSVKVPCGLIPGGSGGGAFIRSAGEITLVGIISTVTTDLTSNGLVPMQALRELLNHPARYTNELPSATSIGSTRTIARW